MGMIERVGAVLFEAALGFGIGQTDGMATQLGQNLVRIHSVII